MDLTALLIKALGGGLTGYATNSLAIKMLFKKIGPWGGVILETREEFIENTSRLVERDIINHRTIEEELAKEEFRAVFKKIIEEILSESWEANTHWGEIPAIEKSKANFFNFYDQQQEGFLKKIFASLLPSLSVGDLIGEQQLEHLTETLLERILKLSKEHNIVEDLLGGLYEQHREAKLADFISPSIFNKVAANIEGLSNDFHLELKNHFEEQIDQSIDRLYEELKVAQIMARLEDSIQEKSLAQILGRENTANIANQFRDRVLDFLQSQPGQDLIINFLEELVNFLKGIEFSILELLNQELRQNLENFMEAKLPGIVEDVIRWIKSNQVQIEALIDEAVEEALSGESKALMDWIRKKGKQILYNLIYSGSLARKEGLVAKIIEGIREETDIKLLSREVSAQILSYIKTKQLGEIVEDLESRGLLKIEELSAMLNRNINKYLAGLDLTSFDFIFETALGEIMDLELSSYFAEQIKEFLVGELKEKFLFTERTTNFLQGQVRTRILASADYKFSELIRAESWEQSLKIFSNQILAEVEQGQSAIIKQVLQALNGLLEGQKLDRLLDQEMESQAVNALGEEFRSYLKEFFSEVEGEEISSFYQDLEKQEELVDDLTEVMLALINQNLATIIEGRIEGVVADNLSELPDSELQKIVEEFMGTELKPITIFGAILGLITAILVYLVQSQAGIKQGLNLPISFFSYGLVGYLTNVIALKMVFRPYSEQKILGLTLPFTPGVVTKQKPRFAKAMGQFVAQELLNKEAVEQIFKSKRSQIESSFKHSISSKNYQLVEEVLHQNLAFITREISNLLLELVDSKQEDLIAGLTIKAGEYELGDFDFTSWESELLESAKALLQGLEPILIAGLEDLLNSEQSLGELLPSALQENILGIAEQMIASNLEQVRALLTSQEQFKELLGNFSGEVQKITEHSLEQLLSGEHRELLKKEIRGYFRARINSRESREQLLELIEERLLKQIGPEQKIGDLFDGMLLETLNQESDYIIKGVLDQGQSYLADSRVELKRMIVTEAQKEIAREKSSGLGGFLKGTFKELTFRGLDIYASMEEVVDILIDNKLPAFMESKEGELRAIFNKFLEGLAENRVADLGLDLSKEGMGELIDSLLVEQKLINNLEILLDKGLDALLKLKLSSLLKMLSIEDIFDILNIFEKELKLLQKELATNLRHKESVVQEEMADLVKIIIEQHFLSIPLGEISTGLETKELTSSLKKILDSIESSPAVANSLEHLITLLFSEIKEQKMGDLVDLHYLELDLKETLVQLLAEQELRLSLESSLGEIIEKLTGEINNILEQQTKDFMLELGLGSTLDAVENNFLELMNSVDIQEVTQEQIRAMNPQEIEELFNSFAQKYFRKLELYGWAGSLIGLATESLLLLF